MVFNQGMAHEGQSSLPSQSLAQQACFGVRAALACVALCRHSPRKSTHGLSGASSSGGFGSSLEWKLLRLAAASIMVMSTLKCSSDNRPPASPRRTAPARSSAPRAREVRAVARLAVPDPVAGEPRSLRSRVKHSASGRCAQGPTGARSVTAVALSYRYQLETYLCHAPADIPLASLAHLAGCRWPFESCFQESKQNLGLGDYEGRSWQGRRWHMTLCLLAHFFWVHQTRPKKSPA